MSVIKNDDNIKPKNMRNKAPVYEIPAVIRKEKDEISFEKALVWAFILHPAIILILLLFSIVLKFLGIDFNLFNKPELKPKDIEFVLVEKEAPPINKNTKNRADKNSQAGGKHDPKRPVSLPQTAAPKAPAKKPSSPAPKKPAAQKPKPQAKPQSATKPQAQKPAASKPQQQAPKKPAPKPQAPKPTVTPSVPKPAVNPSSNFNIPIPKSAIPQIAQPTTAPVTSAPKIGGGASGAAGKSGSASPSFSPTTSSRGGSGGGGRFSNSTGSGRGNIGNPGPGNPNGAPGIDAIKEPDFGPYMKELQRRIKMNWDPPKGNESKRVILLFSITRDGRLKSVKVHRSSGLEAADRAAMDAVKLTAPFRPLPPEFKGESVDIQFTFDYNVFGVSG
ncbi:TPA: TonB C-terminal domain-containing protein [Candidatus Avigastranaerophilus faecigallinarum]|nr:TonB C-terminal domain-containing protein [Candidatus Avigastranaerophilus faecigallinarum]